MVAADRSRSSAFHSRMRTSCPISAGSMPYWPAVALDQGAHLGAVVGAAAAAGREVESILKRLNPKANQSTRPAAHPAMYLCMCSSSSAWSSITLDQVADREHPILAVFDHWQMAHACRDELHAMIDGIARCRQHGRYTDIAHRRVGRERPEDDFGVIALGHDAEQVAP